MVDLLDWLTPKRANGDLVGRTRLLVGCMFYTWYLLGLFGECAM
jgi:hypothetical protein